jgi:hypothetical protein
MLHIFWDKSKEQRISKYIIQMIIIKYLASTIMSHFAYILKFCFIIYRFLTKFKSNFSVNIRYHVNKLKNWKKQQCVFKIITSRLM